jgi:hypothetical protein
VGVEGQPHSLRTVSQHQRQALADPDLRTGQTRHVAASMTAK